MSILGIKPLTDVGSAGKVNVWKEEMEDWRVISCRRKWWCSWSSQSFQESSRSQVHLAVQGGQWRGGSWRGLWKRWPLCNSCYSGCGTTDKFLAEGLRQLSADRAKSRKRELEVEPARAEKLGSAGHLCLWPVLYLTGNVPPVVTAARLLPYNSHTGSSFGQF